MTDKEYKQQKKRVEKLLDKWAKPIGMGWQKLDIVFARDYYTDGQDILATTHCLWEYRKALITFHMPVVMETDDEKLEHNVVHELAHVLTFPLWQQLDHSNKELRQIGEYTAECITDALIWARLAGEETL